MSTQIDKVISLVVRYCQERYPEGLDAIFDLISVSKYQHITQELLEAISTSLQNDTETLAWLCGYMAGEINRSSDNYQPFDPITSRSQIPIKAGMRPFIDFTPYPGCRLVIANITKFKSLPQSVKSVVKETFNLLETPNKQMEQMNNALLQEMVVAPMISYCPGFTRCPIKVIVPNTLASSLSGFAFRSNALTAAVPWTIPFFGSNVARTSALPIEPGNVAVG